MLPHNFCELIDGQIAILQGKPFEVLPDFPQGGIMDASGLRRKAHGQDQGACGHRAQAARSPETIVIRQLPGRHHDGLAHRVH